MLIRASSGSGFRRLRQGQTAVSGGGVVSGLRGGICEDCYGELVKAMCGQSPPEQPAQKSTMGRRLQLKVAQEPPEVCRTHADMISSSAWRTGGKRIAARRWHYDDFPHLEFLPNQSSHCGRIQRVGFDSAGRTLTEAAKKNNAPKVKKRCTRGEPSLRLNSLTMHGLRIISTARKGFMALGKIPGRWPALGGGVIFLRVRGRA